jgi:hypothetical protein
VQNYERSSCVFREVKRYAEYKVSHQAHKGYCKEDCCQQKQEKRNPDSRQKDQSRCGFFSGRCCRSVSFDAGDTDKAAAKGYLHKNAAARKKSRLTRALNNMTK